MPAICAWTSAAIRWRIVWLLFSSAVAVHGVRYVGVSSWLSSDVESFSSSAFSDLSTSLLEHGCCWPKCSRTSTLTEGTFRGGGEGVLAARGHVRFWWVVEYQTLLGLANPWLHKRLGMTLGPHSTVTPLGRHALQSYVWAADVCILNLGCFG